MPFPLAIPVAISAIKALVKFRGRLDTILSLSETATGLPFVLPPAPTFNAPYIDAMAAFFGGELGQGILVIRGKQAQDDWAAVKPTLVPGTAVAGPYEAKMAADGFAGCACKG